MMERDFVLIILTHNARLMIATHPAEHYSAAASALAIAMLFCLSW